MGVALHKPADNIGRGFVHTYRLMNGRGYHMSTDSNLFKWAWLTKEAGLCYDIVLHVHIVTLINLARGVIPGQSVKRDLDDPNRFNIATKLYY